MLSSRWRKVLRDLWQNKGRSLLVVLSIAVGVFAVGTVVQMREIVEQDMIGSYERSNPANVILSTEDYFDDDLLEVIREMPEVAAAEGRSEIIVRMQAKEGAPWYPLHLTAISDYENMEINILHQEAFFEPNAEAWPGPVPLPPPEREIMLERTSCILPRTGCSGQFQLGDRVLIETPLGRQREMRMAGLVGDFARVPATFAFMSLGYVTFDTMEWLGLPRDYNQVVLLVSGDRSDKAHNQVVADVVADRIERSGVTVAHTEVPEPGKLPLDQMVQILLYILAAMGALALGSSVFLLINTMQALLTQQVLQIGVMKALGARGRDIAVMYLTIILIYGLLALLIAVPLGTWIARRVLGFMIYLINFQLSDLGIPPRVLVLETALALLVPLLAGLWPILSGVRITVREAIADYGLGQGDVGDGLIDRLLERVRGLPRPLLLSLRNTFRRKGRLTLTLVTLILAGTIFVAVVSVRASMTNTLDEAWEFYQLDVIVALNRPYRIDRIENVALSVPGVRAVESWTGTSAYRLRPDGSEGKAFPITGAPPRTQMIQPQIVKGRWLLPGDKNALVLTTNLAQDEPDVAVGDDIVLEIQGRETTWRIVGIMLPPQNSLEAYADFEHLSRVTRSAGRASSLQVVTEQHDGAFQAQVAEALEERFDLEGLSLRSAFTVTEYREASGGLFNILITFLMSMAVLMAVVGGIGLMGTMLLNVLERIREVGVMRAIGARTDAVIQIFVVEGAIIGLLSWVISLVLAWPVGKVISATVGGQLIGAELSYVFSLPGVAIWLVAAILLSVVASYFPAQNAARLTVREVLSYEG
jgi:putative ABC transport system permease protein